MASPSQILKLLVTADVDGAVSGLKKVGDAADKDLGRAETQAEKTSARLTKMGAASLAAGAVMATALAKTIEPASALNEAINLTGLTFGDSADEMKKWAEGAARSVGLATDEALKGAAAIGGLLKNVGFLEDESADLSRQLVTLAADMGSAFDMSTTEALEALRSGLAGEAEPLKRFNVFLNEAAVNAKAMELGLADSTAALDDHDKAQARLAIIMEQTADIQGDFAATADSAANSSKTMAAELRNLKATIGEAVLPIFQQVIGVLNEMFGAFNSLPGPVKDVIGTIAVLGTGFTIAAGAALSMLGRVRDLRTQLKTMSTEAKAAETRMVALGLVIGNLIVLQQQWNAARERSKNANEAFAEGLRGSGDAVENTVAGLESMAELFDSRLTAGFQNMEGGVQGLAESLNEGELTIEKFASALHASGVPMDEALTLAGVMQAAFENSSDAIAIAATKTGADVNSMAADVAYGAAVFGEAANAGEEFATSVNVITPPVQTLEEALDGVNSAFDRYFGTILSASQLESEFQQAMSDSVDALLDANGAIDANKVTMDASTEAGRENIDNLDNFIGVIGDTVDAMTNQGKSQDEIRAKLRGMISDYRDNMEAAGLNEDQVAELTEALNGVPAEVITRLENEGYDDALAQAIYLRDLYDSIPRNITTTYSVVGLTGTPGYTTDAPPDPVDPEAEPRSGFGKRVGRRGDAPTEITIHNRIEVDGREIAKVVERESDRSGGLRVKIRGGQ